MSLLNLLLYQIASMMSIWRIRTWGWPFKVALGQRSLIMMAMQAHVQQHQAPNKTKHHTL